MIKTATFLGFIGALCSLAIGVGTANAQATRTWVSGVGDDANPCSRTAPCKTFAGAISKTAASGEIDCLDPGGFGAVTITKAITIDCTAAGLIGGVLVSGTNGIVVQAASTDRVALIGLDIDGLTTGLNGVLVNSANHVTITDSIIYGFTTNGVFVDPSSGGVDVDIVRTKIYDNQGNGVNYKPTGGASIRGSIKDSVMSNNGLSGTGDGIIANDNANPSGSLKIAIQDTESVNNSNGSGFGVFSSTGGVAELVIDGGLAENNSNNLDTNGGNATIQFTRTSLTAGTAITNSAGTVVSYSSNIIDGAVVGALTTVASQ